MITAAALLLFATLVLAGLGAVRGWITDSRDDDYTLGPVRSRRRACRR